MGSDSAEEAAAQLGSLRGLRSEEKVLPSTWSGDTRGNSPMGAPHT